MDIVKIGKVQRDLGPQVTKEINRHIQFGERIAASLQVLIIFFMIIVWLFAAKSQSAREHSFQSIPVVMSIYGPLLLMRLYWAYRGKIDEAMSTLYTFIDIVAIIILIFLYHLEYQALPSMSLKSPTFQFLIVTVSLRCLSFRANQVLFATFLASLGWTGLTLFAINHSDSVITRSFFEYTSTDKILLGAEVEKIIALLLVGGVLSLAVRGAKQTLENAVLATQQRENLSLFFSPEVSELIRAGKIDIAPGKGEKRLAAVLFLDLRNFTKIAQTMDPDHVMNLLIEYQKLIVPIILKHRGTVDKFLGDGILAHFGAAYSTPSYASDCLLAVNEIVTSISQWNNERAKKDLPLLELNMAGASGLVIFGATGGDQRLEMTIIGPAVNLAAKLEKHNKVMESCVCISRKLLQQAKDQGFNPSPGYILASDQMVAGLDGSIDIYHLPKSNIANMNVGRKLLIQNSG